MRLKYFLFDGQMEDVNYNITQDNEGQSCCVPGYELMNTGVRIPLDNALTSELVIYSVKNTKTDF